MMQVQFYRLLLDLSEFVMNAHRFVRVCHKCTKNAQDVWEIILLAQ